MCGGARNACTTRSACCCCSTRASSRPHWFETGSPRFLIERLFEERIASPRLDGLVTGADRLSAFDVDHVGIEALLFQTGYLTIVEEAPVGNRMRFRLGYPNLEVRQALNEHLLRRLGPAPSRIEENQTRLHHLLEAGDTDGMERLFHAFFAGIPHQWHTKNDIANYEGYCASVFYSYFAGTRGGRHRRGQHEPGPARHGGAGGRTHLPVRVQGDRAVGGGLRRMAQLKERRYADP